MRINRNLFFVVFMLSITTLTSCIGSSNAVETCVLSNKQYNDKTELESAEQPENFEAGRDIYASVRFIESPLGMEYTGKWFLNDKEIKTETKAMVTNRCGIIIFSLEADKVVAGKIRFEILYNDTVLFSKELSVK